MADDVEVKFGASLDGLKDGLSKANEGIKTFADQAKEHAGRVSEGFSKIQEGMIALAAVAAGGAIFKEFVSSTLEMISAVVGLQKAFGLTLEEANSLKSRLDLVGVSTESYTGMASRLDRQLKANNESLAKMGMGAKDLALGQEGVMQKALQTLAQYKEGIDRNIAAQVLFGRGGAEALSMLKLGMAGVAERAHELEESLGLTITEKNKSDARAYKMAMNEISMAFDGVKKSIGENVLPYLTRFSQWVVSVAPTVISGMQGSVKAVVDFIFKAVESIGLFVINATEQIENFIGELSKLKSAIAGISGGALAGAGAGLAIGGPLGAIIGAFGGGAVGSLTSDLISGTAKVDAAATDFDAVRKKFTASLAAFKDVVENGPMSAGTKFTPAGPGTKSASNLLGDPNSGGDSAAMKAMQGQIQIIQAGLETKKALYEIDAATYSLTEMGKVEATRTASNEAYQAEMAVMQKTLASASLNAQQRQTIEDKITVMKQKHVTEGLQFELQAIQIINARYTEFFNSLQGSFNGQLRGLLARTTSWKNATKTILGDMIIYFIEMVEKMVLKWAAGKLTMLTIDKTTAASSAAVDAAGTAASGAQAVALIQQKVGEVYAGAAAFFAPLLGPGAPAAAAGVATAVDTAATGLALAGSAEQGAYEVTPGLWQLHANETVLPAPAAQAFRDMAEGNGSFGGSNITIHAIDAQGVAQFFKQHASLAVKIFGSHAALNRG